MEDIKSHFLEIPFEQIKPDYLLWGSGLLPLEFC
jgi:hypothetical protein